MMHRLVTCLLALCLCIASTLVAPPSMAQSPDNIAAAAPVLAPDYDAWGIASAEARAALEAANASTEELDSLRTQLSGWRERFLAAQDINARKIGTLREQMAALGPEPAEGESEPQEIANRRSTLDDELQEALAPVRAAEEAYSSANGLITELDALVRDRQAERLFRLDATPLNPVYWPNAIVALGLVVEAVTGEVANNYASSSRRTTLRASLPLTVVLLLTGLVLVTRSGAWIEQWLLRLRRGHTDTRAGFRVMTFLGSLLGVILPVAGILALIRGIEATQMSAVVGDTILMVLTMLVALLAAARWLSNQIFPKVYPPHPLFAMESRAQAEGRFYAIVLALLLALNQGVSMLSNNDFLTGVMTPNVQAVLTFPIIAIAGLMLARLSLLILKAIRTPADTDGTPHPADDEAAGPRGTLLGSSLARGALIVGFVSPLIAAIGYVTAGATLVFASIMTLALFAFLAVMQRFVRDVYAMVSRDEDNVNALIPVLIGFVLAILALPALALIWGARLSDISETWAIITAGVQLGDTRISPSDFLTFAVIFGLGYGLTRLLQSTLKTQVLPKTKLDLGGRNAVVSGIGYVGIFLAALLAITGAGIDLSSLAIVAGALSVGIGFGLQTIVSNFVSGIILLVERPISEGDWIEVSGTMGVVRDISVRATRVETFDRRDVIVPNADLISTSVTNWTKGNLTGRIIVPVGVAYGTDTRKVETILQEIAEAHPQVIINPPPNVFFIGFGADSLDFEIRAILRDVNYVMRAPSDLNHEIARRFTEEGIEIPFAQRDLWLRNPETLGGGGDTAPDGAAST